MARRWDLEHVARSAGGAWELLCGPFPEVDELAALDCGGPSGTFVLLEGLDRVVAGTEVQNERHRESFFRVAQDVKRYLAMVFHRYLEPPVRLRIFVNRQDEIGQVRPWNPFMDDHLTTSQLPADTLRLRGSEMAVQGYLLPHKDQLTAEEYENGGGIHGWIAHQGFYVYRNDRLLVPGGWLGLGRPRAWTVQAPYNLARIALELPNEIDSTWQIDVKKSSARVPREAWAWLNDYAEITRDKARRVFVHRGKYGARKKRDDVTRAWTVGESTDGRNLYRINRSHPTVRVALQSETVDRETLKELLAVIEETVPVQQIWIDTAEREGDHVKPFESEAGGLLVHLMKRAYQRYRERLGLPHEEACERVLQHEEFQDHPEVLTALGGKEDKGDK